MCPCEVGEPQDIPISLPGAVDEKWTAPCQATPVPCTLYCTLSSHIRHELYELGQLPVVQIMSGNNHLKFLTRLTGTASGGRIPFFGQHGPGQL